MTGARERYASGWRAGATLAGIPAELAQDSAYARGYRHGQRAYQQALDSFLAAPERESDHGHLIDPPVQSCGPISAEVMALFHDCAYEPRQ